MTIPIWSFAGTSLASFGKVTMLNDYLDLPDRRGDNQLIPYHHGKSFVQKYYDTRKISIGIAIGTTDGAALETVFDNMRKLFTPRTEGTLANTREDGSIRNALASVDKMIGVDRKSAGVALAVIDFNMSSPFFRAATVIADNTVVMNAGTVAGTVINTGTVDEMDPVITMVGPLNNPILTNAANGYVLSYAGTIAAAATVTIQTISGEFVATMGTANVIGNLAHSPGAALMQVNIGTNVMSYVNAGGTTGTIKISFYAPYV